jgi:hypothetical protein
MAPADGLLRLVVRFAPVDDRLVLRRMMLLVIAAAGAVRIAHAFHVVRETHFHAFVVVWNTLQRASSL